MLITTVQVPSATTTIKKAYFTIAPDEEYTCRSSKGRVLLFVRIIFPVAGSVIFAINMDLLVSLSEHCFLSDKFGMSEPTFM